METNKRTEFIIEASLKHKKDELVRLKHFLKTMLFTQISIVSILIVVVLNIPIARQIVVFVCISFIPGILILKILRIDLESGVNTILLSVGLSVAFLMFVGLLVNELFPLIGVSEPLSTLPLLVTISTILTAMSFVNLSGDGPTHVCSFPSLGQVFRASLLIGVPLLAIFGALLTNSFVLLLMVVAIVILVILAVFSKRSIPPNLYSFVLLIIAVSLLFQKEFISKYLVGWDVFTENYVLRLAKSNSLWNAAIPFTELEISNYNSMLSVTILPTIYSNLLNMQGEWVFKVVYLLLYSLVPITLYQTYHQRFGKSIAFLSVFYFVLFPRFYGLASRRQMIAELFFALLIFLMINGDIKSRKRQTLSIIFGAALVVSHYSISYIYLFYIFLTWFSMTLLDKHWFSKWHLQPRRTIVGGFVLFILILTFSWYTYVSIYPFNTLLDLVTNVSNSFLVDFFNPRARGMISEATTPEFTSMSSVQLIDFVINKFIYFFIFVGVICFFRNHKQREFDWEYGFMMAASAFTVLLVIVIPYIAPAFLADRFYHVTLFCLAPIAVLGGKMLFESALKLFARVLARIKPSKSIMHARALSLRLMCIFLVIIFLFKVGFIYEVVGDVPISRSISFMRMKTSDANRTKAAFYDGYATEQDVSSAIWLSSMAGNNSKIYADLVASKQVLIGYGMIIVEWKYYLSKGTIINNGSYIYLRSLNVAGIFIGKEQKMEFLNLSHVINNTNKIYSNGASEIYRSLPGGQ